MNLLIEKREGLGIITLNRPKVLNVLNLEMVRALTSQLQEWKQDSTIKAVLFRGAERRAFCAGGDIRSLYKLKLEGSADLDSFFTEEYELDYLVHCYPKPTIAIMDGLVMGGGVGIAQACSCRLVTEDTKMAMPETAIGLFPDVGASYFLSRIPFWMANYVGLVGDVLRGRDALICGLADQLIDVNDIDVSPNLLNLLMSGKYRPSSNGAPGQFSLVPKVISAIERHFSQSTVTDTFESLSKETDPELIAWAKRNLDLLNSRSPLMLQVTFQQLKRGRDLSLEACFYMERNLMHHCFDDGDAIEGIRALLIDKDLNPTWKHKNVSDVSSVEVARFFDETKPIKLSMC